MSAVVWTGASELRVGDGRIPMWQPVELDADAIKWLIRRNIHVRPLVTVDEAVAMATGASDAGLNVIAERLRLSGDHESIRAQVLARLGVVAEVAETEPSDDITARRELVAELRDSGNTWQSIADQLGVSVSTVRNDYDQAAK